MCEKREVRIEQMVVLVDGKDWGEEEGLVEYGLVVDLKRGGVLEG